MTLRDDILAQAWSRQRLAYRMVPPPDGVTTTDCSRLVMDSVGAAGGGQLPRTAEAQRQFALPIAMSDLQPADLLCFEDTYDAAGPAGSDGRIASHIGFALDAGGTRMLDAHDDRPNRLPDVGVTDITTDYWRPKLIGAYRLPALAGAAGTGGIPDMSTDTLPRGIDVAVYQGNPDWDAVAASGVTFAFTKATQGVGYVNPTLGYNWSGIGATPMARGAYHFGRPDLGNPEGEALFFRDRIAFSGGLKAGDLLALDLEEDPLNPGNLDRTDDLPGWCLRFLRRLEALVGFKPLLYSNPSILSEYDFARQPELGEYGLWLATYPRVYPSPVPDPPAPWKTVAFWQYSSEGSVPGISGDVDQDLFNGSAERIRLYGMPTGVPPVEIAPPEPPVQPAPSPADDPDAWVRALAYLADDVAAIEDRDARLAEARRVREQYVGPRSAA